LGIIGALTFLPAFAQVADLSLEQDNVEKPAPRQFGPIRDLTDHGNGTSTSANWSGYAVLGSSFTWAKGSWVVPTANCSGVTQAQYAAMWVGLDGYSSGSTTVEQTGTDSDCNGSIPTYYAWYEFYPSPSNQIGLAIKPGDVISALVYYNSSGNYFTVQITNVTTGQTFNKSARVSGALRSSAEWIMEAPCCTSSGLLPLADFGTVTSGKDATTVSATDWAKDNSTTGAIGSYPAVNTVLINKTATSSSPQTSTCSALSSTGTSFSCTWAP
jgi:hypothetical protein